jgi:drug/metabolite transporter (DMT)-like permease
MTLWLLILVRIVANPAANVLQKLLTRDGASPLGLIFATHLLLTAACLPLVLLEPLPARGDFWWNIGISALMSVAGNTLLVYGLRLGDLSLLGPINAYKAVVSLVPSLILLGELPEPAVLGGIALIVAGSVLLAGGGAVGGPRLGFGERLRALGRSPGVRFRVAALLVSATEAVFLKRAVLAATPTAAFAWWSILGAAAAGVTWLAARPAGERVEAPRRRSEFTISRYVYLTIATGMMQYCTIAVIADFEVGPLLALFQISTILSVFFGYRYFAEPHFARRLIGSAIMVVGAAAIIVCRGA